MWIKGKGQALDPTPTYTFAVQDIATHFEHYLAYTEDLGLVICDARSHSKDILVGHSIVTQKHQVSGDAFPHLVDAPVFGRSQNYVGIQIADLVASAIVFPAAAYTSAQDTGTASTTHRTTTRCASPSDPDQAASLRLSGHDRQVARGFRRQRPTGPPAERPSL